MYDNGIMGADTPLQHLNLELPVCSFVNVLPPALEITVSHCSLQDDKVQLERCTMTNS